MSTSPFDASSRYYGLAIETYSAPDGRQIGYVQRRFIPQPETLALIRNYIVNASDRLDNVAAQQYGDPTQSWQLCDANNAFDPADLTATPGRSLRVTLPQGIPGTIHV
jgi:hypothetical protein